jgi:addiction module RelB/DinJ family antitoxin
VINSFIFVQSPAYDEKISSRSFSFYPKVGELKSSSLKIAFIAQICYICVMGKTAILRTRVDADAKAKAEQVLSQLGLSLGDAVGLLLSQISIQKAIPFPITTLPRLDLSNATIEEIEKRYEERVLTPETAAALNEDISSGKRFKSSRQLLKALKE